MFTWKKLEDRDYAAKTVMVLARRTCGYRDIRQPLKRIRCDCKYGIADYSDEEILKHHSEQNGCPELNMLEEIIRSIPKRDWERIVKRISRNGMLVARRTKRPSA